jgi:hypothetical protein
LKAAVHQPQYFPYPGFFQKLTMADVFVIMDDVQYDKRFTNRNRILNPRGPLELTVPINKAHKFLPNMSVEINNGLSWREDHWKKILLSYSKAKSFHLYRDYLQALYKKEWSMLFELDLETTKKTMEWLGIKIPIVRESELNVSGTSNERLTNVCKKLGADTYVSGSGGVSYMDEGVFERNNIKLLHQNYVPVPYPQRFSETFVPNLSIIDMLANAGLDSIRLILGTHDAVPGPDDEAKRALHHD